MLIQALIFVLINALKHLITMVKISTMEIWPVFKHVLLQVSSQIHSLGYAYIIVIQQLDITETHLMVDATLDVQPAMEILWILSVFLNAPKLLRSFMVIVWLKHAFLAALQKHMEILSTTYVWKRYHAHLDISAMILRVDAWLYAINS